MTSKKKTNVFELNKKNYKKITEESKKNELDNIPKNQRILTRKDIKYLKITFIYVFIYYFNLILFVAFYILLLILWTKYFTEKNQLFILNQKNNRLKASLYRAINS